MTRQSLLISAAVAAALATGGGAPAVGNDDDHDGRRLKADLRGFQEVPAISSPGRGSFRGIISHDGTEIAWRLDYRSLQGTVTQAHIHLGDHHTNGGISVFLCSNLPSPPAGTQPCPAPGPGAEVTGTSTMSNVIGPAGQGIAAGEFAELIRAIRAGVTYANVHTNIFPGGEIRGQIRAD